jgi:hypothetical protein
MPEYSIRVKEHPTYNKKEGRVTELVTSCVGSAFSNTLLNERQTGREDEEEEVGW